MPARMGGRAAGIGCVTSDFGPKRTWVREPLKTVTSCVSIGEESLKERVP
jgi:hypothetical protein